MDPLEHAAAEIAELREALHGLMRALNETPDSTGELERSTRSAYNAARAAAGEPPPLTPNPLDVAADKHYRQ